MEARALSECGTLSSWNLFEVIDTGAKHLIGYAPNFKFDVITDEIVNISFDRKSKSGAAVTKTGILYELSGKPVRVNLKWHPQAKVFVESYGCSIRLVKLETRV